MMEAIETYRPVSAVAQLDRPYVMLGFNLFAAHDAEAEYLASSMQQALSICAARTDPAPAARRG